MCRILLSVCAGLLSPLFILNAGSTTPKQQRAEWTHPSHEVHSSPSVQQQRGHVDVAVVSRDVEGRETALTEGESRQTDIKN